ncbi:hypothetical protein [Streptomyces sp. NPDC012510]|uniref:hypothetical protein n=1 Tax=Streptomyces sp. NPDC012510 TaxID=3364838 RepID=UPI0036E12791
MSEQTPSQAEGERQPPDGTDDEPRTSGRDTPRTTPSQTEGDEGEDEGDDTDGEGSYA